MPSGQAKAARESLSKTPVILIPATNNGLAYKWLTRNVRPGIAVRG
jgi:hypothetical protein